MNQELRPLYLLNFPLLLASVGWLAWVVPNDWMLLGAAILGVLVGAYALWQMFRQAPLRFTHTFAIANLIGYGVGLTYSWFSIPRAGLPLAFYFGKDTASVTQAMAGVLISSALLFALGEAFESEIHISYRFEFDSRLLFVLFSWTAALIVAFLLHKVGYMGMDTTGGTVNPAVMLILDMFSVMFGLTALGMLQSTGFQKWALRGLLAVQFVLMIPIGRRGMFYTVLTALLICSRFGVLRVSRTRKLVYAAVLIGVLAVSMTAFYYLRFASFGQKHVTLADRIDRAEELYESGNTAKVNNALGENLQKRTFILGYVSDLLERSSTMTPAMGWGAAHAAQMMIPSALWGGKELYDEETIGSEAYGLPYRDEANSTFSAGLIDFGFLGMLIYPLLLAAAYRMMAGLMSRIAPQSVATIVMLFLLANALVTEAGLWTRFVIVRNSVILAIGLMLLFKIPRVALREPTIASRIPT
jgi:hypothetical protein